MIHKYHASVLILALSLTLFSACGGGGGDGVSPSPAPPAPLTVAVVRIATNGALDQDNKIGGITVDGVLPEGVTVKASPDSLNPSVLVADSGAVVASGVTGTNTKTFAVYHSADRRIAIYVFDQNGFGAGEFVTITCNLESGAAPQASDFSLTSYKAVDLSGVEIPGLTPGLTVHLE